MAGTLIMSPCTEEILGITRKDICQGQVLNAWDIWWFTDKPYKDGELALHKKCPFIRLQPKLCIYTQYGCWPEDNEIEPRWWLE